ncbi:hypothetical protein Rumal_3392 (plasmid) [Ruminococcus albus 7 = DSM 20455]|uniref:Uncharacterized protein n=1 Tax=Ruminococcus albus (strain ATCC 27210 / DSM 20455 / JCM 14654 / NCDO 2250 / 7) TaxID=697329 RepID=E6UJK4_RUMA7|nr:hypothetical protein Rumal_3392 [Ruminococcus albus 7 = DSM 20455]
MKKSRLFRREKYYFREIKKDIEKTPRNHTLQTMFWQVASITTIKMVVVNGKIGETYLEFQFKSGARMVVENE